MQLQVNRAERDSAFIQEWMTALLLAVTGRDGWFIAPGEPLPNAPPTGCNWRDFRCGGVTDRYMPLVQWIVAEARYRFDVRRS